MLPIFFLHFSYERRISGLSGSWKAVSSEKKVFLEISQKWKENTCDKVLFLIKLEASACNFIKKEILTQVFPVNFVKFVRTPFRTEHLLHLGVIFLKLSRMSNLILSKLNLLRFNSWIANHLLTVSEVL